MKKKRSLGTRIMVAVMAVLAYGILSAGVTGMVCLNIQSQNDTKNSMSERVAAASNLVSSSVSHYISLISALDGTTAQANSIIASDTSITEINTRADGAPGVTTNSDGYIVITGTYSKGTASITTNTDWLAEVISTMHTSNTTEFYLINGSGSILASVNGTLSAEQISGHLGSSSIRNASVGGKDRILYSVPISGTDWTAFVSCDSSEFNGKSTEALLIMIGSTALSFVLGALLIRRYVKKITVPLNAVNGKILDMAAGKLSTGNVEVHTGDELENLADAVNSMAEYTEGIIKDIQAVAAKIAAEDLTAEPAAEYVGDYAPIREALEGIISSTSNVIRQIEASSELVSDGSGRMSDNSTMLSQAATEQAATVEELNASIVEISSNITANADSAAKAKTLADDCMTIVDEGNVKMTDMLHAMEEINETSAQIANIIKTIEDISFQTNILSLNASIEAARAGEAGKGFAVVAGEVGQLAGKTAEAAKNTTSLIKTALIAVQNGTVMANETAKMLSKIVEETDDTAKVVEKIAAASQEQADSVKQILVGMDQISNSVQMTSGSSAECAASAEELSGQAKVLLELVQRFKVAEPGRKKKNASVKPVAVDTTASKPAAPVKEEKKSPAPEDKPAEKPAAPAKPAEKPKPIEKKPAEKPKTAAKSEKAEKPEKPAKFEKPANPANSANPATPATPAAKPEPAVKKPAAPAKPAEKKPAAPAVKAEYSAPKRTIILDDDKY